MKRVLLSILLLCGVAALISACSATAPSSATPGSAAARPAERAGARITVLYDAFGKASDLKKGWGYAALIEYRGQRILFDTGDNPDILIANAQAKGVDLAQLDAVVLSHRHGDHMAGLGEILKRNPGVKVYAPKEGFGVYGGSLPSTFYRKDASLPADQRYFDGQPADVLHFGSAWHGANFQLIEKTTEIAPGLHLIALVSDNAGTLELRELSLAIDTPEGIVLVVGCSHPGIDKIVQVATTINPRIQLIAGGFHLVNAKDEDIAQIVATLRDTYKVGYVAPGHCTGEPTFKALIGAFGPRYLYAGLGVALELGAQPRALAHAGTAAPSWPDAEDWHDYRRFAAAGHDHGPEMLAGTHDH